MPEAHADDARLLFQRLGEKWTIPLLGALSEHAHRYSEIKRRFPLTSKVLSRTLSALQQDHLVTRVESPSVRRSVTYELTPAGRQLIEFVRGFAQDLPAASSAVAPALRRADAGRETSMHSAGPRSHPLDQLDTDLSFRMITIATRDLAPHAHRLGAILGVTPLAVTDLPIELPSGGSAQLRLSGLPLGAFSITLAQPLDDRLPHAAFLTTHGTGIHHLGFDTTANLDQVVPELRRMGGTWTVGGRGAGYAQLDFRDQLGAAIGILSSWGREATPVSAPSTQVSGGLELPSRHRVTNVGVVVRSIEETARAYAEIFGLGVSPIRAVDLALPGVSIVSHGSARVAYLRLRGVGVKLIEPLSEGPLTTVLDQHGNRAHHLGFDVGRSFTAVLERLESLGGFILLGRRDLGYVLVDFREPLGLVLELTGSPVH